MRDKPMCSGYFATSEPLPDKPQGEFVICGICGKRDMGNYCQHKVTHLMEVYTKCQHAAQEQRIAELEFIVATVNAALRRQMNQNEAAESRVTALTEQVERLKEALKLGKTRYSRDHYDSEPFPYEVGFTIPQWKEVEKAVATADYRKRWRESHDPRLSAQPTTSNHLHPRGDPDRDTSQRRLDHSR